MIEVSLLRQLTPSCGTGSRASRFFMNDPPGGGDADVCFFRRS
jgi:hypothetical protein